MLPIIEVLNGVRIKYFEIPEGLEFFEAKLIFRKNRRGIVTVNSIPANMTDAGSVVDLKIINLLNVLMIKRIRFINRLVTDDIVNYC